MSPASEGLDNLSPVKRALLAIETLQAKLDALQRSRTEPIAIVGMGCRFPGGIDTPQAFWQLLCEGREVIREVPAERFNLADLYDPNPEAPGKMYMRYGGFLEQSDGFDAQFFRVSPREARQMDPQQRLLLEVSWEALEHAGQAPDALAESQTGVFMGVLSTDYAHLPGSLAERVDAYYYPGVNSSFLAGRVSYFLGLHGQSLVVDTACSSSLAAVHLACQSLRSGESDLALAGGVNLILSPEISMFLCKAGVMSPSGRCRAFDQDADGMVRGEGCGVVVLKRLTDALAAGDTVHAVIRGSAVNHDGASGGLTVPSPRAQALLYRAALHNAGVQPDEVSYIETHGTGTRLGDPVELQGLSRAFCTGATRSQPLYIGSVKTNIGHTDSAAGIAGLMKTVLILQHGSMPPSLHFRRPNPEFAWDQSPLTVVHEQTPLPAREAPHIAGVSAFGLSGMNAHVVVEAAPPPPVQREGADAERPLHLLTLSAQTDAALHELAARYEAFLAARPQLQLADVCFTANTGRTHFPDRLSVVAASIAEMQGQLRARRRETHRVPRGRTTPPRVAFLFTGQGAQYVGMGRQLYARQPTFRRVLERCDAMLRPYLEHPLLDVLYPGTGQQDPEKLHHTAYAQPALFALEYALATLWQSWGITPDALMGHSVGEYVAACVAGVFSLEEGLTLIAERGRLMQALPQDGSMMAVFAAEDRVRAAVLPDDQNVAIAAVNGPRNVVISGQRQAVLRVVARLEAQGIRCQALQVSHAFHSPLMEPMLAAFAQVAQAIRYAPPQRDLISNVTGASVGDEVATAGYWCRHVRQPVRFAAGMATLHQQGCELFVEVGPQPTLLAMGRQCLPEGTGAWLPSLRREREWEAILRSVSELYERGAAVDWVGFDRDYVRCKLALPTYPFQRQRYWVRTGSDGQAFAPRGAGAASRHPLLGQRLYLAGSQERRYESQLGPDTPGYLAHHRVFDSAILPAAAYLEMALAAGLATFKPALERHEAPEQLLVEGFVIHQALVLPDDDVRRIQCTLAPADSHVWSCQMHSTPLPKDAENEEPAWQLHASGRMKVAQDVPPPPVNLEALRSLFPEERHVPDYYRQCRELGIEYGTSFQAVTQLWGGNGEALAQVHVPDALADEADYVLHPVLLDACLHVSLAALPDAATEAYVAVSIERMRLYRRPGQTLWSHVRLRAANGAQRATMTANVRLFDESGAAVAEVEGLTLKATSRAALLPNLGMSWQESVYEVVWHPTANAPREDTPPGHWLVFNDSADTGGQLAARLRAEGAQCTLVFPGQTYGQLAEAAFRINPANPGDYQRLLQAVPQVRGVISLWSLDAGIDDFETVLRQVCGSTLHLVHALASLAKPPSLWLVTRGAVACPNDQGAGAGSRVPGIAQSPLWGLGNVIALEYPELHCVRIDLDPNVVEVEALCTAILSKTREDRLAFRDRVQLAPRLVSCRLQEASAPLHFREDAAYLIVGGTRGLGLLVARWMVSKGATYVVLVGRTGNVDAAEITALERTGARVLVEQADVSEADQVARVLAHIEQPLRGVIHAAGVLDDGILQQQTVERFAPVMAPKVQGAWHLHALTQDMPLDFFVLFSSVASLLGSSGQANYAAANAFLDALAHHRRAHGLPAVTINWGGWSEVGAAARDEIRARMRKTGLVPISPEQGLAALEYLLSQSSRDGALTQVGVVPIDWSAFLQHFPAGGVPPFLSQVVRQARSRMPGEPPWSPPFRHVLEGTPANERREQLATHVRAQVAQVLGLPEGTLPPPEQGFFNLGMDSLLTLELRNRLQASLACTLPNTLTFNYPTIEALVAYLAEAVLAIEPAVTSEAKRPRENAELGAMLAEVERMTDDAVQQLLRRRS